MVVYRVSVGNSKYRHIHKVLEYTDCYNDVVGDKLVVFYSTGVVRVDGALAELDILQSGGIKVKSNF